MSTHGRGMHHHPPFFIRWPLIPMAASLLTWWVVEHHLHEYLPAPWPDVLTHPFAEGVVEGVVLTLCLLWGQLRLRLLVWIAFLVGVITVLVGAGSFVPATPPWPVPWVTGILCILAWTGSGGVLALIFRSLTKQETEPEPEGVLGYPFVEDAQWPNRIFAEAGWTFILLMLYIALSAAGAGLLGVIWWNALRASFFVSSVVTFLAVAVALLLLYMVFRLGEDWQSLKKQWVDMRDLADYAQAMDEWEAQRDAPQQEAARTPPASILRETFAVATAWGAAGPLLHLIFELGGFPTRLPNAVDWFILFFFAGAACSAVSGGLRILCRLPWVDRLCLAGVLVGGILGYWLSADTTWPMAMCCATLAAFSLGCVSLTAGATFDLLHAGHAEGRPV